MSQNAGLGVELQDVLERLAARVHERWCAMRLSEGWTYGPERNDALRQTPCLVPYDELPESEKSYDRETAGCVIQALLEEGFSITRT